MLNKLFRSINKSLSLTSLVLNGGTAAHSIMSKFSPIGIDLARTQIESLTQNIPKDGLISDIYKTASGFSWSSLALPQEVSILSQEGICKSGLLGLLELKFSDSIFPHTTHFGVVYPALVLAYGENWHSDGKLAIGLCAVGAFETVYWWMDCDQPEIEH